MPSDSRASSCLLTPIYLSRLWNSSAGHYSYSQVWTSNRRIYKGPVCIHFRSYRCCLALYSSLFSMSQQLSIEVGKGNDAHQRVGACEALVSAAVKWYSRPFLACRSIVRAPRRCLSICQPWSSWCLCPRFVHKALRYWLVWMLALCSSFSDSSSV